MGTPVTCRPANGASLHIIRGKCLDQFRAQAVKLGFAFVVLREAGPPRQNQRLFGPGLMPFLGSQKSSGPAAMEVGGFLGHGAKRSALTGFSPNGISPH